MTTLLFFFAALVAVVSAAPLEKRDVFVPPILYPHAGTVWKVGQKHNVTWSTADAPTQITNKQGMIVLATNGLEDIENPLASGFDILLGRFEVTVPDVADGNDYALVLFGDSGNFSPNFTITH
ncbi:hypothetical protein PHLGIDRAFT_19684 [Phlebiopsis gigantea 11061_1 CR5-6]|uniref:Yeast cell wall synthesis Kre9/Knh1-like N-terminal domain-containing protein n=1 Tax=Phlebiopsis gigantea (strain 11061_1 CR5-6) TaxID=745531 RepID=A0A0C3NKK3_PHLG1|nr:hypothetical protein PHLGIDRAFT_19684 [Phlebiopsis gigantea 11061_1 CR5-6]